MAWQHSVLTYIYTQMPPLLANTKTTTYTHTYINVHHLANTIVCVYTIPEVDTEQFLQCLTPHYAVVCGKLSRHVFAVFCGHVRAVTT